MKETCIDSNICDDFCDPEREICKLDLLGNPYCDCKLPYVLNSTNGQCVLPAYCEKSCPSCALLGKDPLLLCYADCYCICKDGNFRINNTDTNYCQPTDPTIECNQDSDCGALIQTNKRCVDSTGTGIKRCECIPGYTAFTGVAQQDDLGNTFYDTECRRIINDEPVAACYAWGDPHYTAFNKKTFDFQSI